MFKIILKTRFGHTCTSKSYRSRIEKKSIFDDMRLDNMKPIKMKFD